MKIAIRNQNPSKSITKRTPKSMLTTKHYVFTKSHRLCLTKSRHIPSQILPSSSEPFSVPWKVRTGKGCCMSDVSKCSFCSYTLRSTSHAKTEYVWHEWNSPQNCIGITFTTWYDDLPMYCISWCLKAQSCGAPDLCLAFLGPCWCLECVLESSCDFSKNSGRFLLKNSLKSQEKCKIQVIYLLSWIHSP